MDWCSNKKATFNFSAIGFLTWNGALTRRLLYTLYLTIGFTPWKGAPTRRLLFNCVLCNRLQTMERCSKKKATFNFVAISFTPWNGAPTKRLLLTFQQSVFYHGTVLQQEGHF
jgi:hypothetical protein